MPIDYKKYPKEWKLISKAVIKKAENKCELCNAENYKPHWKTKSKVILTVHHIDCILKNNSKYNLIALCQRCHLRLDLEKHISKRHKIDKDYWLNEVKQLNLKNNLIQGINNNKLTHNKNTLIKHYIFNIRNNKHTSASSKL